MTNTLWRVGGGLVFSAALSSCASVSEVNGTERPTSRMPELVCVLPFTTAHGEFNVDRTGKELADFKENLQATLQTAMIDDLCDRLVPAVPARRSDWSKTKNAWLVRGKFTIVNQGSRLLRTAVGFGAGRTRIETQVDVYDLAGNSATPFLIFATTGGSGAQPGELIPVSDNPYLIGYGLASHAIHGLTEDSRRTAREITAVLSDYMYRHGWIAEEEWIKPKKAGGEDMW